MATFDLLFKNINKLSKKVKEGEIIISLERQTYMEILASLLHTFQVYIS